MPTFTSQIVLSSGAESSGTAGIDNSLVKGALKSFATFTALTDEPIDRLKSGQLVYVSNTSTWYEPSLFFSSCFSGAGGGGGGTGIFSTTGSVEATTNDLEVTGSVKIRVDSTDEFQVVSGSLEVLKVNNEGVLQFGEFDTTPTAVTGGMFLSSSGEYYLSIV
jgi:hypothetical protein